MAGEPELGEGDSGEWVSYLQKVLAHLGHPSESDGSFGAQTAAGVRAAQTAGGVEASGRVDLATWALLRGGVGGGEYKVSFYERPVVRDGAVVWSVRNDGPAPNTGERDQLTLSDVDTGNDLSVTVSTWAEELQPAATASRSTAVAELFQGTPSHEDTVYRLDVRLHIDGHGDEASVNFKMAYGQAVPA